MNIVVIGNGKIGRSISERLANEGHNLVIIDNNEKRATDAQNERDIMSVIGNGATRSVQLQAGVNKADLVLAVTSEDERNLLCCLIAKKLGAKRTIARVRNPEYADDLDLFREDMGLSLAINPELSAARDIFNVLRFPGVFNVDKFAKGRVEIAEFKLNKQSPLATLTLNEINRKFKFKMLICAVRRGGSTYIPNGDFKLQEDDRISFLAKPDETEHFLRATGMSVRRPRNVVIVGGGRISYYLIRMLKTIGVYPTIIERDMEKCKQLSATFPNCLIINGDGADRDLLREEGLQKADAFVSLTGTDEVNILLSMYATNQKVPKVVTKISRFSIIELVDDDKLGSIISPRDITATRVASYVRAKENTGPGNVETLYRLVDGAVEAVEFIVREENPKITNIPLKRLETRENMLICCIIRNGKVIIPDGNEKIRLSDRVIVVTNNRRLANLKDIIAEPHLL